MTQPNPVQTAAIKMALQNPEPGVILIHDSLDRFQALIPVGTPATAIEYLSAAEAEERIPDLMGTIAETDFTIHRIICGDGKAYVIEVSELCKHTSEEVS